MRGSREESAFLELVRTTDILSRIDPILQRTRLSRTIAASTTGKYRTVASSNACARLAVLLLPNRAPK
jgi:hypothetical protein